MEPVSAQQGGYLTAYSGWTFGGQLQVRAGELNLAAAWHYGAELEVRVRRDATLGLIVDYQQTVLRSRSGIGNTELFFSGRHALRDHRPRPRGHRTSGARRRRRESGGTGDRDWAAPPEPGSCLKRVAQGGTDSGHRAEIDARGSNWVSD